MTGEYQKAFDRSMKDPNGFWGDAAEQIHWFKKWDKVLDDSNKPFYRWFSGGLVNTCYNTLDRHVDGGRGDQTAVIYDSPVTNTVRYYTYREFRDLVAKFAGALTKMGITKGDRVIVYMPMVPEALIATHACARIGAVHSVVFGGFAAQELAVRIDDAAPKAIIAASCGIEVARVIPYQPLIEAAIELSDHKPEKVVVVQRPQQTWALKPGQLDFYEELEAANPVDCVPVLATDPLYILYTSGTTGQPKGVVRDNGGHLVALNWTMKNIYNINPGEVFWAASDVGWVVGHSYIIYGQLINGATTVVYEGKPVGTPDAGAFWRMIEQHKIKSLFTAPTAFRAIKREDPKAELMKKYDLSKFEILFLAGERTDPDTLHWAQNALEGRPVIDHWWQTETGWAIAANCMGIEYLPVKAGSPTRPVPGWNVQVLDENCKEIPRGQQGTICVQLPLPPGTLPTLWKNDDRFLKSYLTDFPGYYTTADAGFMDEDGYVYIMARTDDVINVAGHRLSTGAMEEVLAQHPDVAECAVVGVADNFKGQLPVGFMVLKAGVTKSHDEIIKEVVKMVRDKIGPVAAFKTATVVDRLPKTRSGKILRGTMQKIADNEPWKMPATIDDPIILDEIKSALEGIGYASARKETAESGAAQ